LPARRQCDASPAGYREEEAVKQGRGRKRKSRVRNEVPLYQKVVQHLKRRILSGAYPVGAQLPTEGELSERFEVSRHTVREALRRLREDGLVASRQGAGTTVRRVAVPQPYVHEVASIDDLVAYASGTQYRADSSEIVLADAALARRLEEPAGQRWLRIDGYRYAEPDGDLPICWTEVFVHASYAGVGLLLGRRPGPIYGWIEDQYGERIVEVQQLLAGRPVPAHIAPTLQVDTDSTVVEVRRKYLTASGTTAEVSFNLYPAERFTFSMTMRRASR
jgi:DNA-binding GntR family transcriptional regulator